jgi:hypothetical protein
MGACEPGTRNDWYATGLRQGPHVNSSDARQGWIARTVQTSIDTCLTPGGSSSALHRMLQAKRLPDTRHVSGLHPMQEIPYWVTATIILRAFAWPAWRPVAAGVMPLVNITLCQAHPLTRHTPTMTAAWLPFFSICCVLNLHESCM